MPRNLEAALRASTSADVNGAFVIVRPHPSNTEQWHEVEFGDPHALVYPRRYSGMPLRDEEVEVFRYSLLASTVVVGVNTTAMIEAAILRRPVFSVRDPGFAHSQQQTLHFGYLTRERGGCATVAESLAEHVLQVEAAVSGQVDLLALDRFVQRFVRPLGLTTPATTHLCDAIELVAARCKQIEPLRGLPPVAHATAAAPERRVVARER